MHRVSAPVEPPSWTTASRLPTSKYCFNLARSWARSASPKLLDHGLQMHVQTRSITASNCISKLARLRPPSSHHHGLQVHIFKLVLSRPPGASPNLLDHGLPVHLQTQSIMASNYISKHTWLWPPSASPYLSDHRLGVYLWVHSITVWWNGGASRIIAHHQHSAAPRMASKQNSRERAVLARGV